VLKLTLGYVFQPKKVFRLALIVHCNIIESNIDVIVAALLIENLVKEFTLSVSMLQPAVRFRNHPVLLLQE
jgi:hypothetical protein